MAPKTVYLSEDGLARLLKALGEAEVYAPVRRERGPEFARLEKVPGAELALRQPRPSASPKAFLLPARERVAVYTCEGADEAESRPACAPRALVGLRACDLAAIRYLDKVFGGGDTADPFYQTRRAADMLVSTDCVAVHEDCFCAAVGGKPFAEDGFDLNLSPIASGYLVDVGTDKGRAVVEALGAAAEATPAQVRERDDLRRASAEQLARQTAGLHVSDTVQEALLAGQDAPEWSARAAQCVECAACTFICPTCHCFYLYDQAGGGEAFERVRTWDSCLLGDYHRM
ncbi:MAG: 4Fe-4S dicluster domain-containing protein, partial [Planctomycetes bacterium]|nr:4Fe-4S dicluster domain-containing protein [Planctomycetota bacterium]